MRKIFFLRFTSIMILGIVLLSLGMSAWAQNVTITDDDSYIPDIKAMLDVKSTNKGLLIPRVALISTTSPITGKKPIGLLVWNISTSGTYFTPGFYFWNGSDWEMISSSSTYEFWTQEGNTVYLTDTTNKLGIGVQNPTGKVEIKSNADAADDDPIFEVKNKYGEVMFGVYNEGVRVFFNDAGKSSKAGFAVAKTSAGKAGSEYLRVTSDSVRIFIDDAAGKSSKAGFAVAKTSSGKGSSDFLSVMPDSTRIYVDGDGGFAVDNIASGSEGRYVDLTPENYFIGHHSGEDITSGRYNLFLGYYSGANNKVGLRNTFIGHHSGYRNTDGDDNIFIGDSAGFTNVNSSDNIFIGNLAGFNTEADDPVFGSENVFIGSRAGFKNLEGYDNVFIGNKSGEDNLNGRGNVFIGGFSGNSNKGRDNAIIGGAALWKNETGNRNTALGAYSGNSNISGTGNIFIGYESGYNELNSNRLYIENSNSNTPLIYGEFDNDIVTINGRLGVGTSSPQANLHILGDATSGTLMIAPNQPTFNGDSRLLFAEDNDFSYGISLEYDGSISNYLEIIGMNNGVPTSPHFRIERDNGTTYLNGSNIYLPNLVGVSSSNWLTINTATGQIGVNSSSRRYKNNINKLDDISWLYDLSPVSFNYKDDETQELHYGLIAEEVELVNKNLVLYGKEGTVESVSYPKLIAPLIKAVQDQQKQIDELRQENQELREYIDNLKVMINNTNINK